MMVRRMLRWALLIGVTAAVTYPLDLIGVPSAALFAALVIGIALALASLAPDRISRRTGLAAQGVLGVYIGTMVHQDAVGALGSDWPIVVAIAVATLLLSRVRGAAGHAPRRHPVDWLAGAGGRWRVGPRRDRA
jgi:uncharacterized membrane protein AbrB (regulator of aidB expression)